MSKLSSMPVSGVIVIFIIAVLFAVSVILLFTVCARYRWLIGLVSDNQTSGNEFLRAVTNEYAAAYKRYGVDVNTPAIISNAVAVKLSGALFCERFLNNAVSLFVTLGLFGTFLGLSHSVASLTELISYSNTSEWLSVLDSVGGGLMSALSGMGVFQPMLTALVDLPSPARALVTAKTGQVSPLPENISLVRIAL